MPELPEVETVRRGLQPAMEGALRRAGWNSAAPIFDFPFRTGFAHRISRAVASPALQRRRAKYLLVAFRRRGSADIASRHVGLILCRSGQRLRGQGTFHHQRIQGSRATIMWFSTWMVRPVNARVVYNDPRRFGFMLLTQSGVLEQHPLIRDLGCRADRQCA